MVAVRLTLTAVVLALAGACSGGSSREASVEVGGQSVPARRLEAVAEGVCRAAGQAASDAEGARRTFFGQAHEGLHTIARGLEDVDRSAAAGVLVAKQAVEADFSGGKAASALVADLRRLAQATRAALDRLGVRVPACETG